MRPNGAEDLRVALSARPELAEDRIADRTRAKAEMKALTSELKRDAAAEAVMKSRARELGIEAGSRLERVLEAKSEREAMRLERGLGLSR